MVNTFNQNIHLTNYIHMISNKIAIRVVKVLIFQRNNNFLYVGPIK